MSKVEKYYEDTFYSFNAYYRLSFILFVYDDVVRVCFILSRRYRLVLVLGIKDSL